MSNVAIIIARGGSKRIPRKNIKMFKGKPIIAYSIETALSSASSIALYRTLFQLLQMQHR